MLNLPPGEAPATSLSKYQADAWENLKALWMLWVPAQLVNFSIVPVHLRIPFVAGVSFAWTVILSVLRGALEETAVAAAEAVTVYADDREAPGPRAGRAVPEERAWEQDARAVYNEVRAAAPAN